MTQLTKKAAPYWIKIHRQHGIQVPAQAARTCIYAINNGQQTASGAAGPE
jgi:hypothetical protein